METAAEKPMTWGHSPAAEICAFCNELESVGRPEEEPGFMMEDG